MFTASCTAFQGVNGWRIGFMRCCRNSCPTLGSNSVEYQEVPCVSAVGSEGSVILYAIRKSERTEETLQALTTQRGGMVDCKKEIKRKKGTKKMKEKRKSISFASRVYVVLVMFKIFPFYRYPYRCGACMCTSILKKTVFKCNGVYGRVFTCLMQKYV